MSLRTSATRYAKALFDVALTEADPGVVERDLAAVVAALQQPELRRVLSGMVPEHIRRNIMRALAERIGVQPPVAKLLNLLAERGRMELLPDLLEVYRERLLAHANVVRATVTSAAPLPPDRTAALAESLSTLTGKQVQLETTVDPAIIGGVVARIGSTVYDGSIRTQLQKMKQQLVQGSGSRDQGSGSGDQRHG